MPFFPRSHLQAEPTLFQILSAIESQPSQKSATTGCEPRRRHAFQQTFTPRFDVTETEQAYELYGEVPGLESEALRIEFSDAQTLVIQGRVGRLPERNREEEFEKVVEKVAENEHRNEEVAEKENNSHAATVEDEYDETDKPLITPSSSSSSSSTSSSTLEKGKQAETQPSTSVPHEAQAQRKFWITERQTGNFARSFSFEQRVEADFVTAGLRNGVLHVVVPKSLKSRRVVVSVN